LLAPACSAFLALALEVEERVVDADGEAYEEHDGARVLVHRPDLARDREQAHRGDDRGEREQQGDARGDERAERHDQDSDRDRDREQAGPLEVLADRVVDLLVGAGRSERADRDVGIGRLGVGDGGENRVHLVDRLVGVSADVEADERGMTVGGDLVRVAARERALDVGDRRKRGDAIRDVVDRAAERGTVCRRGTALDQHDLAGRSPEVLLQDLFHAAGLPGHALVVAELLRPHGSADHDCGDHEREPTEGRCLPVRGAPAPGACCEIAAHGYFPSLALTMSPASPQGTGRTMAAAGVSPWW
jgi:hypothetical protein